MAQHNVWFLEPQRNNACDRQGRPAQSPCDLNPYEPLTCSRPGGLSSYYQTYVEQQRCSWQGCEIVLRDSPIPLCYEHANRVWAYVDQAESTAEKDQAKAGLDAALEFDRANGARSSRDEADYRNRKRNRLTEPGEVYYLLVGELVKIGFTANLESRLKQYPPNAILLTRHPGTMTLEADMHNRFKRHLAKGREWFRQAPELMEHIQGVEEKRIQRLFDVHKSRSVNEQLAPMGLRVRRQMEADMRVLKTWAPETAVELDFHIEPGSVPVSAIGSPVPAPPTM